METVKLGTSGLEVSRLCLGGMSFGDPSRGNYPWTLPYDESLLNVTTPLSNSALRRSLR